MAEMTPEFQEAMRQVMGDARISDFTGSDLVAAGVQRSDCVLFLADMLAGEPDALAHRPGWWGVKESWLLILVQWCVAIGVWIERARWQGEAGPHGP